MQSREYLHSNKVFQLKCLNILSSNDFSEETLSKTVCQDFAGHLQGLTMSHDEQEKVPLLN